MENNFKRKKKRHIRSKKRRKFSKENSQKEFQYYYYTYYRGWCENDELLLFPTPASAMVWQLLHVVKDGFCQVFLHELPLTFSVIGVIRIEKTMVSTIERFVLSPACDIRQLFSDDILSYSSALEKFLTHIQLFRVVESSFFKNIPCQNYLQQMNVQSFYYIRKLFSQPDYFSSSQSIVSKHIVSQELLNQHFHMKPTTESALYCPHAFDSYNLRVCNTYSIQKSLQSISLLDKQVHDTLLLNDATYSKFSKRQCDSIQALRRRTRVIISIGCGTSATEIISNQSSDYIICLDKSRRDLCTAIFSSKILRKDMKYNSSKIVFALFDLKKIGLIEALIKDIWKTTKIKPTVLFQHPSPNVMYLQTIFAPALKILTQSSLVDGFLEEIVVVYDAFYYHSLNFDGTGTLTGHNGRMVTISGILEEVLDSSKILQLSEEFCLSSKGQKSTLHPLFDLNERRGWARMKRKAEYCQVLRRKCSVSPN